jgi:hypothetical protein
MKQYTQESFKEIGTSWAKISNQLSQFGKRKDKIYQTLDDQFGHENWTIAHFFNGKVTPKNEAFQIYEQAYYQFLKENPRIRKDLVNKASEVYDNSVSNIESGLNYRIQETNATHLQDIAIRRALTRIKLEEKGISYKKRLPKIPIFKGDYLVKIRSKSIEGGHLSPGRVPFHKPDLILNPRQRSWWNRDSIEDWYQSNKLLLIEPNHLRLVLILSSRSDHIFQFNDETFYRSNGHLLIKISPKMAHNLSHHPEYTIEEPETKEYSKWKKTLNLN